MQYNLILESVDNLPLNQQIKLSSILKKRIIEKKRELIRHSAELSKIEYENGGLMKKLLMS